MRTIALAVLAALPIQEAGAVEEAAEALRSDPVYVDAGAERALSESEADELRDRITASGVPVFVAVLPAAAAPDDAAAAALPGQLADATGLTGPYAVLAGDRFRATAGVEATTAFQAARDDGVAAVLLRFVDEVAATAAGNPTGTATEEVADDSDGGSSLLPIALLGAGGVGVYAVVRRRRRRQAEEDAAAIANDVQVLRAELSVLSEDVLRLESDIVMHPEARLDFDAAVDRFRAASAALDYADDPVDLVRVARVVSEARYAMARARAIVGGYPPPPPPDELQRPGRHDEPPLTVDDGGQVVYAGGGPFYGGGWFGGSGGLCTGLLLGSRLSGPFGMFGGGWGGGWGDHGSDHGGYDGGGGWGGGDFGGGDFGGGDIGGGDF